MKGDSVGSVFTPPRVSAVIPTLGRQSLLRAVDSALSQSVDVEVVVVLADPRERGRVEAQLADRLSNVQLVSAGSRISGSAARNLGARAASGDAIAFLDDDDWWDPTKTDHQASALAAQSGAFSTTASWIVDPDGQRLARRPVPVVPYSGGLPADYVLRRPRARYGHHFVQTSSFLVDRSAALEVSWDESLPRHQDWDFFVRFVSWIGQRPVHVPEPLTMVSKDSPYSVSKSDDWQASLVWLASLHASGRASNDFLAAVVLRPALARRDWEAVRAARRLLRRSQMSRTAILCVAHGSWKALQA